MRFAVAALSAAVLSVSGCSRVSTPDGLTLLARYHQAEQNACYSVRETNEQVMSLAWPMPSATAGAPVSTLLYGRPVSTTSLRVQVGPDQSRSTVLSRAGLSASVGMVQARDGMAGWRYLPSAQRLELLTYPAKDVGALNWMALVLNNYATEGVREDNVAGTPAWYLEVRPKNTGRPMKRLWLDKETYLPLRQEFWSADGRLLSATQVLERPRLLIPTDLSILIPPSVPGMTVVQWDQEKRVSEDAAASALGFPLAQLGAAPRGFVPVGTYLSLSPDTLGACARWELTDGIATVNVIQTRKPVSGPLAEEMPGDVQGPMETAQSGAYHFIVRGNLSRHELRRIAESIVVEPR